jgi:YD repeat-containing protein
MNRFKREYVYHPSNRMITYRLTPQQINIGTHPLPPGSNVEQTTQYILDVFGRVNSVQYNNTNTTYQYDGNGNRTRTETAWNGQRYVSTCTYNSLDLPERAAYTINGVERVYTYTYYADGKQFTMRNPRNETTTYTYDGLGQLLTEEERNATNTVTSNITYAYDFRGNRLRKTAAVRNPHTVQYQYNSLNQLTQSDHRVNNVDTRTFYVYNTNGDQTSRTTGSVTEAYTYDKHSRITSMSRNNVILARYSYRPDGYRHMREFGGVHTLYVWDDGYLCMEWANVSGRVHYTHYHRGLGLIARDHHDSAGGQLDFCFTNGRGDVAELVRNGVSQRVYDYDAFGNDSTLKRVRTTCVCGTITPPMGGSLRRTRLGGGLIGILMPEIIRLILLTRAGSQR